MSTALHKDYVVSTYDETGITLESAQGLSLLQFQPGLLTEFYFEPLSTDFGAKTSVDITLTTGVELPCTASRTGCYLTVQAPYLNPYSTSRDKEIVFDPDLLRCEAISASVSLLLFQ